METFLVLLRHGETEWSRHGRYQGRSDSALTSRGRDQVQRAAEHLAAMGIAAIVSSPLRRARASASIVARRLDLSVVVDERLAEIAYGDWEGLTQADVRVRWPELLRRWKRAADVAPPGGERLSDLRRRVRSFLLDYTAASGPILAVTHAGVIRTAILEVRGEPLSRFRQVHVANGSLTTFDRRHGRLGFAGSSGPAN